MNKAIFKPSFLKQNLMGPNCILLLEELMQHVQLSPGMRVLDLSCGTGLTSIYLATHFDVQVFAVDLWISATQNYERFKKFQLSDRLVPIHADVNMLPFANQYFDAMVCIDAYHYYGADPAFLGEKLLPLMKQGGQIGIAVPGLLHEFTEGVPEEMQPYLKLDMNSHTSTWWHSLFKQCAGVDVRLSMSMQTHQQAWDDWLKCDNPYAKRDIDMMRAEQGKYFDTVKMVAIVK